MLYFFFQAEDGIRDGRVTGVQTCALPICSGPQYWGPLRLDQVPAAATALSDGLVLLRSEERRVGKECRSRGSPHHYQKRDGRSRRVCRGRDARTQADRSYLTRHAMVAAAA